MTKSRKTPGRGPGRPRKAGGDDFSFTIRIGAETARILEHYGIDHRKSKNDVVREVLDDWTKRPEIEPYIRWVRSTGGQKA